MSDLISRQAAIDAVYKIAPVDTEYDCTLLDRIDVRYVLTELPSTDRKGHWVSKDGVYGVVYCSECDYELHSNDTNFCPNCGADMRGDNNDEV